MIVVPAFQNPLKNEPPTLPEGLRKEMLIRTFSELKNVEISYFEWQKGVVSYTYNTLMHFKKRYQNHLLYLLVGEDAFASFHLWAKADMILQLSKILVFHRSATSNDEPKPYNYSESDNVEWMNIQIPNISATSIRQSSVELVEQKNWLHPEALPIWKTFKTNPNQLNF